MRVLIATMRVDPARGGGTGRRSATLAGALSARGVATTVLSFDLGMADPEAQAVVAGLSHITLPALWSRFPLPLATPAAVQRIVAASDVVLIFSHWTTLNLLVAWAARRSGVPYLVLPAGALPVFGRSPVLKRLYNAAAGRRVITGADGWIATTPLEVAQFADYGVDPKAVHVIPNAVEDPEAATPSAARFRDRWGMAEPLILFAGRLAEIKGPDLLVEAFARLAGTLPHHLVLAGPDDGMQTLVAQRVAAHGLTHRVHLLGHLDRAATFDAYAAADLLVVPSRYEAMSLVAIEAALTATPVVLTETCGFPELADHGATMVAPTVDGLTEGIRACLATPEALPERGQRLAAFARRAHTWDAVVPRYLAAFAAAKARRERRVG